MLRSPRDFCFLARFELLHTIILAVFLKSNARTSRSPQNWLINIKERHFFRNITNRTTFLYVSLRSPQRHDELRKISIIVITNVMALEKICLKHRFERKARQSIDETLQRWSTAIVNVCADCCGRRRSPRCVGKDERRETKKRISRRGWCNKSGLSAGGRFARFPRDHCDQRASQAELWRQAWAAKTINEAA